MERIETRAGPVACEIMGSGPPVVLLHAIGHDHRDFDAIVPTLATRFRTIAIDWPGFGSSPPPDPPSSASASSMCGVLEDVVDRLALAPAIFIGNSVGGTAAVRLAARSPARVLGLVLADTGGFTPMTPMARAFCWLQGRESIRRVLGPAFARFYTKRRNEHVAALLRRVDIGVRDPASVAVHAAMWRSFADPNSDVSVEASTIRCPTLVVWGRRDPVLRAAVDGRAVRESIAHARYVELDTGHTPFVEDPEAFLDVVLPFLDELSHSSPRVGAK